MAMFNEAEWLKLIFLLADTQEWIEDMSMEAFRHIPVENKKKFIRKSYYLSVKTLAHIIERHYYKIPRYPHAGKFHITVCEILQHIRDAYKTPASSAPGCLNFQRTLQTPHAIGFDKNGQPAYCITILTDAGGRIITAFPGVNLNHSSPASDNRVDNRL